MPDQTFKCQKCGADIELTEALTDQIESSLRAKYEADANQKAKELEKEKEILKRQAKELEAKEQTIDEQIAEQLKGERKKIADQKKALEAERQEIEDQVAERLKAERSKLTEKLKAKLAEEQAEETAVLQEELADQKKKIKEACARELEVRKQQQKLEEEKEAFELTVQRKLDEERKNIAEQASKKAAEEQQLKMREKDDKIDSLMRQINELKRKAEVGSQEAQGEVLEEELQELLERSFPIDTFEEIKKGARGADIIQRVHNRSGKECGIILWESKNTKDFQKSWIEKLKKDQQEAGANIAVIMSVALPKEIDSFGQYDGVWFTDYRSAIGLATALRHGLINVARQKLITAGQDSMKDVIYRYVTGQEFSMHIKAVVNAFGQMQEQLEKEKRAMNKIWKSREKQISTVLENVTGIRGSIEGLVGGQKTLPAIETLSLEGIAPEDDKDVAESHFK